MEFPHKRYILFLLSRQMSDFEVRADCIARGLESPDAYDLAQIAKELGAVPTYWRATVTRENIKFRRWLRDKGVLPLWVRDSATERALVLLHRATIRKDFEAIMLAHGDIGKARAELVIKYPEALVPDEGALARYQEFFWDTGAMSPEGIFDYIENMQHKDVYLAAVQGDLVKTYGQLGLQQRLKGEVFLQNVLEAANQQALRMRENPNVSGAMLAGMSSAIKVGFEAMMVLEDRHQLVEGDVTTRREAADFMARVVQASAVPSIDELSRTDVVEAEYVEAGATNVLAISDRRSD